MTNGWYIAAVLVIGGIITFGLRAVPFAVKRAAKKSRLIAELSKWMPVGVLGILAVTTTTGLIGGDPHRALFTAIALVFTAAVHLLTRRHTLLSVGLGTALYLILVNFVT